MGKLNFRSVHEQLRDQFRVAPNSAKRLRALWCLYVTDGLDEADIVAELQHADPYVRAWALQLIGNESELNAFLPSRLPPQSNTSAWNTDLMDKLAAMAQQDSSPIVRLYLASLVQRLPFENRWPILTGLSSHAEDVADNNIWRMIWFALEPLVPTDPGRAMQLAVSGKIPRLNEFVVRRLIADDANLEAIAKAAEKAKANKAIDAIAPGFKVQGSGEKGVVSHPEFRNRPAVQTHPLDRKTPCILYRTGCDIPENKRTTLKICVSHHPHGDWQMRVLVDGEVMADRLVSSKTVGKDEWLNLSIDLTDHAGKRIDLRIENKANDWHNEWAYWNQVEIISE